MKTIADFLSYLKIDMVQLAVLVLGTSEVLLARANNVWLYPTGIAAIVLSMHALFQAKLYAECALHLYYLIMSIYGWIYWTKKHNHTTVKVTRASRSDWFVTSMIVFIGWVVLYLCLTGFTDSENPVWDASVSCTGWAGMWLLARRKVENWILLNISNALAIPLLVMKDLPLFAVLTGILFIVACKGYLDWSSLAKKQTQ